MGGVKVFTEVLDGWSVGTSNSILCSIGELPGSPHEQSKSLEIHR